MKIYFAIISFVLFSIALNAQDLPKLNGNVLKMVECKCQFKMAFGEEQITSTDTLSEYYFDKMGRVVFEKTHQSGKIALVSELDQLLEVQTYYRVFQYKGKQLISINTYDSAKKLFQVEKYTYDNYGIATIDFFDAKNQLSRRIKYTRTDNGKKIAQTTYNGDGESINSKFYTLNNAGDTIAASISWWRGRYTYDKNHRKLATIFTKYDQERYKYDAHNNRILSYHYGCNTFSKKKEWIVGFPKVKTIYEYDKKGNWTYRKNIEYQSEHSYETQNIVKRDIIYATVPSDFAKVMEDIENFFKE